MINEIGFTIMKISAENKSMKPIGLTYVVHRVLWTLDGWVHKTTKQNIKNVFKVHNLHSIVPL